METPLFIEKTSKDQTSIKKKGSWTNEDKINLIKLRLEGLSFKQIGDQLGRTEHSARSEYGRIRRGDTDVKVSLKELPELRKALPLKRNKV
ncbi:TPA: hypothetical protein ENX78_17800 [Candidatus Poribacteria bacterium]|nr:hypothetical protein [Candidatus Poribacteria bacterium]